MRVTELSELAVFEAVARHRSFRKAAEARGVTASAISHAVANLEARVDVRLLNRTTRSVAPTEAGAMLLERLSPAFADIGAALDALNQFRDAPFGRVRINAPNSIAPYIFESVLGPLIANNPKLEIEIVATDRLVDVVAEGFDAGVRLGESVQEGMIAVKIKPRLRFAVIGSPAYFKLHKTPRTPRDLADHICIRNMYPNGTYYPWSFKRGDEEIDFQPAGPIALDDHDLMVQAAISGVGLAYVWEKRAAAALKAKQVVRCLEPWCAPEDWLYLYYPSRKHLSAGMRAVIEAMRV